MLQIIRKQAGLQRALIRFPALKQSKAAPAVLATNSDKKALKLLFLLFYVVRLSLRC